VLVLLTNVANTPTTGTAMTDPQHMTPPPPALRERWRKRRAFARVWGVHESVVNHHAAKGRIETRQATRADGTASKFSEYRWKRDDLYPLWCWRSISSMATWLELPRTTLERRLFERDTIDSLQWAHYRVRESEENHLKWEVRIAYGFGPDALTRADLERFFDDDMRYRMRSIYDGEE